MERSNENDPTLPYVSDVDDDTNPPPPQTMAVWDDDSDDDTLAVMAAGMDPDAHMNYIHAPHHSAPNLSPLEDRREQTLLQVMMAAREVIKDARGPMHQEVSHYLVEKDIIDMLDEALRSYTGANEDFIGTVDGTDATPSTKEL